MALRQLSIASFLTGKETTEKKKEFITESKNKTESGVASEEVDELVTLVEDEQEKARKLAARIKSKLRPECQWCTRYDGVREFLLETPTLWTSLYVCNRCGVECEVCHFVVLKDGNDCCENVACRNSKKH